MARWSQSFTDQQHIARMNQEMPIGGIVLITLLAGTNIEGVLRRVNVGNNAGSGGWQYYGECEIEAKNHQRYVIDYLDIKSATNAWSESKAAEYERLGLITIIK